MFGICARLHKAAELAEPPAIVLPNGPTQQQREAEAQALVNDAIGMAYNFVQQKEAQDAQVRGTQETGDRQDGGTQAPG